MIGLLLGVALLVNAPECNRMALSGNTMTVSECGGTPAPTPAPGQPTPRPTSPPQPGGCPQGTLQKDVARDWVSIQPGTVHTYCLNVATQMSRLTVFTNDRSGVNLCASMKLTVLPPPGSGLPARTTGPTTTGDMTIRYIQLIPPGRYQVLVEGAPGTCPTSKYRIQWGY